MPPPRRPPPVLLRCSVAEEKATPIGRAASIMVTHGFRHLPIVESERTIGIVSLRDVVRSIVRAYPEYENDTEGDTLSGYGTASTASGPGCEWSSCCRSRSAASSCTGTRSTTSSEAASGREGGGARTRRLPRESVGRPQRQRSRLTRSPLGIRPRRQTKRLDVGGRRVRPSRAPEVRMYEPTPITPPVAARRAHVASLGVVRLTRARGGSGASTPNGVEGVSGLADR